MIKVGNVCRCQFDKLAVVTRIIYPRHGSIDLKPRYVGVDFNGNSWESIAPKFVADNMYEWYELQRK